MQQTTQYNKERTDSTGSSTNTVDVFSGIIGGIELYDPVDGRNIQTSGGNVCAE
jgi:hypothetical protein